MGKRYTTFVPSSLLDLLMFGINSNIVGGHIHSPCTLLLVRSYISDQLFEGTPSAWNSTYEVAQYTIIPALGLLYASHYICSKRSFGVGNVSLSQVLGSGFFNMHIHCGGENHSFHCHEHAFSIMKCLFNVGRWSLAPQEKSLEWQQCTLIRFNKATGTSYLVRGLL